MTATVEPAGVSDATLTEMRDRFRDSARPDKRQYAALFSELLLARQQLAEMRVALRDLVSVCENTVVEDYPQYEIAQVALAPTSQPSRRKLSLSEAVEAARGHADPVRDLSAMRGDCAQPERQGG